MIDLQALMAKEKKDKQVLIRMTPTLYKAIQDLRPSGWSTSEFVNLVLQDAFLTRQQQIEENKRQVEAMKQAEQSKKGNKSKKD